jgi:hypothetical protein
MTNFSLAICEKYNKKIHGLLKDNTNNNKYFVSYLVNIKDFYNMDYEKIMCLMKISYKELNMDNNIKHITIELIEPYYNNDVMLCNIKTNVIIRLQQKWKLKYYRKQNNLGNNINNLNIS